MMASGDMTEKQRNALLASMTDEVGRLVLADNYEQNLALASSEAVAAPLMHVHESWIRRLERQGLIDREIEFLPSEKEFAGPPRGRAPGSPPRSWRCCLPTPRSCSPTS